MYIPNGRGAIKILLILQNIKFLENTKLNTSLKCCFSMFIALEEYLLQIKPFNNSVKIDIDIKFTMKGPTFSRVQLSTHDQDYNFCCNRGKHNWKLESREQRYSQSFISFEELAGNIKICIPHSRTNFEKNHLDLSSKLFTRTILFHFPSL